ncbi:MAG: branched-chain amino acid ABC transporter permease [Nitriliruptorales bacterium]|nr:branched-chain amino acid ABC transporter permease [Nitriliruptorales bacterium]
MNVPVERTIVRDALALGVAVGVFGLSFGVLATASGVSAPMACALSALVFAGGAQFAAVGVIAAGGSPLAAVASGLLLNARYAAFGLALAPVLRGTLLQRAAAAHLVIDESAALALGRRDQDEARQAFWTTGIVLFVLWNTGTLLGALAGGGIGDPAALGLDAAFPAGFLALLFPLLTGPRTRVAALSGAGIALALTPFVPPGVPILAAVLGALAALAVPRHGDPTAGMGGPSGPLAAEAAAPADCEP